MQYLMPLVKGIENPSTRSSSYCYSTSISFILIRNILEIKMNPCAFFIYLVQRGQNYKTSNLFDIYFNVDVHHGSDLGSFCTLNCLGHALWTLLRVEHNHPNCYIKD